MSGLPVGTGAAVAARLRAANAPKDPVGWATSQLAVHPWSKQRQILESVRDNRLTAAQSGHGIGKTFTAAVATAWWATSHPPEHTLVVTTAPTARQVEEVLWQEIRLLHARGRLAGRITGGHAPTWRINDRTVALGLSTNDPDRFQGHHDRHMLVILDEAGGIPATFFDVAKSLATNDQARVLVIGNPTDPASKFAEVCAPGSGWNVIRVGVHDTPNFTGEDVPPELLDELVGHRFVEDAKRDWGEGSPIYASRVLGEFPEVGDDTLFPPALILAAQKRDLYRVSGERPAGSLGCDIARAGGGDETVIYRNHGGRLRLEHAAQGHDTMRTTGEIVRRLQDPSLTVAVVDVIGLGAGVVDRLAEQGLSVLAFNAGERAMNPRRFANRRAEAAFELRDAMLREEVDIDPDDDQLAAQLGGIRYRADSSGRVLLERKADMKKRGLPSPDRADAAIMAYVGGQSPGLRWQEWLDGLSEAERWELENPVPDLCAEGRPVATEAELMRSHL